MIRDKDGNEVDVTQFFGHIPGFMGFFKAMSQRRWSTSDDAKFVALEMAKLTIEQLEARDKATIS